MALKASVDEVIPICQTIPDECDVNSLIAMNNILSMINEDTKIPQNILDSYKQVEDTVKSIQANLMIVIGDFKDKYFQDIQKYIDEVKAMLADVEESMSQVVDTIGGNLDDEEFPVSQGWKFMSCSHCQELRQQANWLQIGYIQE